MRNTLQGIADKAFPPDSPAPPPVFYATVRIINGAKAFVTNDDNLKKVKDIEIVVLGDFYQIVLAYYY